MIPFLTSWSILKSYRPKLGLLKIALAIRSFPSCNCNLMLCLLFPPTVISTRPALPAYSKKLITWVEFRKKIIHFFREINFNKNYASTDEELRQYFLWISFLKNSCTIVLILKLPYWIVTSDDRWNPKNLDFKVKVPETKLVISSKVKAITYCSYFPPSHWTCNRIELYLKYSNSIENPSWISEPILLTQLSNLSWFPFSNLSFPLKSIFTWSSLTFRFKWILLRWPAIILQQKKIHENL